MSKKQIFKKIIVGCDHAAYDYKKKVISYIQTKYKDLKLFDVGCYSTDRVDYPDIAHSLCAEIQKEKYEGGILLCGTGIGMSIAANKHEGIICGLAYNEITAQMIREHNNANVLAIGARTTDFDITKKIVDIFLTTQFAGGRHLKRVQKFKIYQTEEEV